MPYMEMPATMQAKLEQGGVQVIRKPFDFRTKTDLYIQLPEGRTLAYYNYLHQIPDTLYSGEEISLGEEAIPAGEPIYTNEFGNCTNCNCGTIWDGDNPPGMGEGELFIIPPAVIAVILFIAKVVAVFIVIYLLISKILHPCGTQAAQVDIDRCLKVITYPDCSTITINSCKTDAQGNYVPEVINRTGPPSTEWITWLIVGAVAIGGIFIAIKVLPSLIEKKEKPKR